jgi:hypothetical protein
MKDTINSNLYDLLNSMGFEPSILDSVGDEVPSPETASVFEFDFVNDGKNYGTVTLTLDGTRTINLIYGKSVSESPAISRSGKSWQKVKEMLNSFAMTHRSKVVDSNQNRLGGDTKKRHTAQSMSEGSTKDRQWSNKDVEKLRVATRDFDDIMSSAGPEAFKQELIKKRIKTKPMSGPKGVLPEEQGMSEGDDHIWGPQGRFAGDTPTNLGSVSMKPITAGDTVKYFGDKAKVVAISKDGKSARIDIQRGMGNITQNVLTSDLKQLGQGISEAYHPVNKQTSHNDRFGSSAKIVLKHSKVMGEGEQRFRHIEKIFIENSNGERFLAPTVKPGLAAIYGRHISEGGTPYDQRGTHIAELITEYEKMSGFVRATKSSTFTNESISHLVEEGIKHHATLRETLKKMTTRSGYDSYFESWTPMITEDEEVDDLTEMFKTSKLDPRIESALPIIGKLSKKIAEMTEAVELEEWADGIASDLVIPTTNLQKKTVYDIFTGEGLQVGADAQNARNILDDVMYDSRLDDMLSDLAKRDPNANVVDTLRAWMEESSNGTIRGLLTVIDNAQPEEPAPQEEPTDEDPAPENDGEQFDTPDQADDMDPSAVTDSNGSPVMKESDKKGSQSDAHKMAIEKLQKAMKMPAVPAETKKRIADQIKYHKSQLQQDDSVMKDSAKESVEESAPDQLKATDKMKNIGPVLGKSEKKHPADGKLVGESLAQILKLSGLKK